MQTQRYFIHEWTACLNESSESVIHDYPFIKTVAVSQYQVRKVRTCILGSSDFTSSTQECELPRTGGHKSGNSANGTAAYLITSVSSPKLSTLYYNTTKYDIKHHCLFLFTCKHINSRKNVVQGMYIHYSEKKRHDLEEIIDSWDQRLPVRFTQNELYLMFNHYRDIRASGRCQKD